jgi:hypothetical protein
MDFNTTAADWISYYGNQESSKDLNKQMGKNSDLCQFRSNDQDCLKNIKENTGSACIAVDRFHEIVLLHQVHILGPSTVFPEEKVAASLGSESCADIFKLCKDTLFQDHEIPVPKSAALKGADTAEALEALLVPDANPPKLWCKSILMAPPPVS